jgi:hypothetical protein
VHCSKAAAVSLSTFAVSAAVMLRSGTIRALIVGVHSSSANSTSYAPLTTMTRLPVMSSVRLVRT